MQQFKQDDSIQLNLLIDRQLQQIKDLCDPIVYARYGYPFKNATIAALFNQITTHLTALRDDNSFTMDQCEIVDEPMKKVLDPSSKIF